MEGGRGAPGIQAKLIRARGLALLVLGSGIVNFWSVIGPPLRERHAVLRAVFPLEFLHISRSVSLLIGFALVISSINVLKRKRRAHRVVCGLAGLSVFFHLTKGLDYEEAFFSALLLLLLLLDRRDFTVESAPPDVRTALILLAAAFAAAMGYGIAGFWLLDTVEFGVNFTLLDSAHRTLLFLSLAGDPGIVPHTRYARWFLDSLYLMTGTAIAYSLFAVFRPALYRFATLPHERRLAQELTASHGRCSMDFFKYWPDKSFFFSERRDCFLAYRVATGVALALGDPIGPAEGIESILRRFLEFCVQNDWRIAFHQTLPDFLPLYRKLGLRKLKIGDDAIVDLDSFNLDGRHFKKVRHAINQAEKSGLLFARWNTPVPDEVMDKLRRVSDGWLKIPGRRERTFTLGRFDPQYVRSTPVCAAADSSGNILAFVNIIPSFYRGEATIDLMRHLQDAPKRIMDYLFARLFQAMKEEGFQRFNLGMAPMAGFREDEEAALEEKAVHYFMQQLNFLFSFQGLLHYKSKYASIWEPRYVVYQNVLNLPRIARALAEVSGIHD
jgi:phosphatidylglycerol lysyltransferase